MSKIVTLNPVNIDTNYSIAPSTPGFSTVALLNNANVGQPKLEKFSALNQMTNYDSNSYPYQAASAYFNGGDDNSLFEIISGNESSAAPTTKLTGPTVIGSTDSKSKSDSKKTDDIPKTTPVTNTNNGLVDALNKYYNSGAEYFLFNVDNSNTNDQQTAIKLAQLVEDQSNGVIIIDIKTSDDHPDLSWAKPLDKLKSEMTVSLPNDDMLGIELLAVRASQSPRANIEFINSLPGITGQDQYQFTVDDYNKYYRPYNVATYCNRNGKEMLTDGDSGSGYQLSNMITRDYLNYQIINNITDLLTKNNGDPGIPYNPQGVSLITNQLRLVLSEAARKNYINSYNINHVDFNKIPQEELAKGQLNGLGYNWAPTQNITGITFHQNINMPNLNA